MVIKNEVYEKLARNERTFDEVVFRYPDKTFFVIENPYNSKTAIVSTFHNGHKFSIELTLDYIERVQFESGVDFVFSDSAA